MNQNPTSERIGISREPTILEVKVNPGSIDSVSNLVIKWGATYKSRCVYATNIHSLMESHDDEKFLGILNSSNINTPDGMPLVWMLRLKGYPEQKRVYGPTLMLHILEAASLESIPVGFYGGKPEVLKLLYENMLIRYPGLKIAYSYSPPFHSLSKTEDEMVVKEIQDSGVQILFVGLGCPKQEKWIAAHRGIITAVMIGVGAAFDFHAGVIPQAPLWMQRIGLEWLFRLKTEPRRLWRRYLFHNPRFVFLATLELLKFYWKGN